MAGAANENLRHIEQFFKVEIELTPHGFVLFGDTKSVGQGASVLQQVVQLVKTDGSVSVDLLRYACDQVAKYGSVDLVSMRSQTLIVTYRGKPVKIKTEGQRAYVRAMEEKIITFATGPAGTGKTFLAVCMATQALKSSQVQRIVLVRPAVEAGESLGFLPGDLREKVEPYLRPLYDAFFDLLSPERFSRLVERNVIEIAPLAYMRGRTLNDSFIILDEAQNTTPEQMKMFLTRIGFSSRVVVTGDLTQVDLPGKQQSGLAAAKKVLQGVEGIEFVDLQPQDVVRHEIVQRVVEAYDRFEEVNRREK